MSNKNKVLTKSEYIAEKLTILRQLGIVFILIIEN